MQYLASTDIEQTGLRAAGSALLDRIGPAILSMHSQGGPSGWLAADAGPKLARAIITVEPSSPPFVHRSVKISVRKPYGITDIAHTYDPPPEAGDAPLRKQASYHATYDESTVRFLRQAGVEVEWLPLAEHGIRGNEHMMFMELNNLEVAQLSMHGITNSVGIARLAIHRYKWYDI